MFAPLPGSQMAAFRDAAICSRVPGGATTPGDGLFGPWPLVGKMAGAGDVCRRVLREGSFQAPTVGAGTERNSHAADSGQGDRERLH